MLIRPKTLQLCSLTALCLHSADGRGTGAVRVSYGYMSDMGDAEAVLSLVGDFFVEGGGFPVANAPVAPPTAPTLQQGPAQAAPGKRAGDVRLPLPMPPAAPQLPHASAQQPVAPPVLPPSQPGKPPCSSSCCLPLAAAAANFSCKRLSHGARIAAETDLS